MRTQSVHFSHHQCGIFLSPALRQLKNKKHDEEPKSFSDFQSYSTCYYLFLRIQILCYKSVAAALQQTEMHFMHVGRDPDTGLVFRYLLFLNKLTHVTETLIK